MASEIKVNTIKDLGGNTIVSSNGSGTISGLPASAISSGTVATARLGSGTASSSTFLAGDQSYKTVSGTTINNNADNRVITGSGTANTLNGEANLTFASDGSALLFPDNVKTKFGTGQDMQIWHDGSNSYIMDVGTGDLVIAGQTNIKFQNEALDETYAKMINNGAVELYHNNVKKIETTATGIDVVGNIEPTFAGNGTAGISFLTTTDHTANDKAYIGGRTSSNYGMNLVISRGGSDGFASETARFTNDGKLFINQTSALGDDTAANNAVLHVKGKSGAEIAIFQTASNGRQIQFYNAGATNVGAIAINSGDTNFVTSSDYRLKENIDYTWDATSRLKQLKPARFNFIADETNTLVDGFLAHEVSSIVPQAIIGTKDAMHPEVLYVDKVLYTAEDELPEGMNIGDIKTPADELPEGKNFGDVKKATKPNYQGIDHSKLVPLLVKTIQELETRITTLENA